VNFTGIEGTNTQDFARPGQMHLPQDAYWFETQLKQELVARF
jgi:hypothetical protein